LRRDGAISSGDVTKSVHPIRLEVESRTAVSGNASGFDGSYIELFDFKQRFNVVGSETQRDKDDLLSL
jgi:hypothetical protein